MDQEKINLLIDAAQKTQDALADYVARIRNAATYEESRSIVEEVLAGEQKTLKFYRALEYLLGPGSTAARAGQFPECVAVGNEEDGFFASGVLLSKKWLLTSAHCRDADRMFPGIDINVGGDFFKITFKAEKELLALFEVSDAFKAEVASPKLPSDKCKVPPGTRLRVIAFGDTHPSGGGYGQQRHARFIVENAMKVRIYAASDSAVCPGDSGGAAFYDDGPNPTLLLAIADSTTADDCLSGGVFASLVGRKDWIHEKTGLDLSQDCPPEIADENEVPPTQPDDGLRPIAAPKSLSLRGRTRKTPSSRRKR